MEIFQFLEKALYLLSKLFFYPVIICLFILLGYVFFAIGGFAKEAYIRWRHPGHYIKPFLTALQTERESTLEDEYEAYLDNILIESKKKNNYKLSAARYCVKMGPTLGLIGTLTPMANALAGLSTGDLSALSGQMISAFSTTVLGLIVGGIAFTLAHVQLKWQHQDELILNNEADRQFFKFKKRVLHEAE